MRMALVLAVAGILLASPSSAQRVVCTLGDVGAILLQRYGEHLIFQGVTSSGALMEVYASQDRGTWTMVQQINGIGCMMSSGPRWEPGASVPESEPRGRNLTGDTDEFQL